MAKKRKKGGDWTVTMERRVTVEIYCRDCTEDEARDNPYKHSDMHSETEVDSVDVDVIDVEPNE